MKICPLCQVKFEDSAEFCPQCKAQLVDCEEKAPVKKQPIPKSFWIALLGTFGFILFIMLLFNILYSI